MSLINLQIDMKQCAEALIRIAVVLERAFPLPEFKEAKQRGSESIVRTSPASLWEAQQSRERKRIRREQGLPDEDESPQ